MTTSYVIGLQAIHHIPAPIEMICIEFTKEARSVRDAVERFLYPTREDYWEHNALIGEVPMTIPAAFERRCVCVKLPPSEAPLQTRIASILQTILARINKPVDIREVHGV